MRLVSLILIAIGSCVAGEDRWANVTKTLSKYVAISKMAFSVGNASGQQYSFGKGGVTLDTRQTMASSSKFPVAMSILDVVNEGHLQVDSKPSEVWDWWTTDASDLRSRVTLKSLLSFTSGLFTKDAGGSIDCLSFKTNKNYTSEECAKQIYDQAVWAFEPGTVWDYNSFHLQVAGAMAAAAMNYTSTTQLLHTHLIDKLGLQNTSWGFSTSNPYLAAGMVTTGKDYDTILRAYTSYDWVPKVLSDVAETDYLQPPVVSSNASKYLVDLLGHYSFCNYYECVEPKPKGQPWSSKCADAKIHMDAGLFGYYPLVDRANNYYLQIVQTHLVMSSLDLAPTIAATVLRDLVKPLVDFALGFGPAPRVPSTADIRAHTAKVLERYADFDTPEELWGHLERLSTLKESEVEVFF